MFSTAFGTNGSGTAPGEGVRRWPVKTGFSSCHPGGAHFLCVDGGVHFESENMDAAVLAALTTGAAGEPISADGLQCWNFCPQ